jgi:formate C-acetyltransferase
MPFRREEERKMNVQTRESFSAFSVEGVAAGAWRDFSPGNWTHAIDVRDFIQKNVTPYEGDSAFLSGATARTEALWGKVQALLKAEHDKGGVLDVDTSVVASIVSHRAGYIDRSLEQIVGLQTDARP